MWVNVEREREREIEREREREIGGGKEDNTENSIDMFYYKDRFIRNKILFC